MYKCERCGVEFEGRVGRLNKYCSNECYIIDCKRISEKKCGVCGNSFMGYEKSQYCSLKCVHASMRQPERQCKGCGLMFAPEKRATLYCSKSCEVSSRRKSVEPDPVPGARWIPLTKGKFALVDEEDFELVSKHSWYTHESHKTFYARSWMTIDGSRKPLRMHHFVLNVEPGSKTMVDHIDHDGLNCRKSNLRIANESQNRMNTFKKRGATPYKGVCQVPSGKFKASIASHSIHKYLGMFNTAEEAARAYDAEARKVHGENGRYNFPEPGESSALVTK